jgi:hypothetical protein
MRDSRKIVALVVVLVLAPTVLFFSLVCCSAADLLVQDLNHKMDQQLRDQRLREGNGSGPATR